MVVVAGVVEIAVVDFTDTVAVVATELGLLVSLFLFKCRCK